MADPNTVAQYIWRRSRELGINPNMALGIAKFEGLNPNTLGSATYGNPDAAGYSFGPFQLADVRQIMHDLKTNPKWTHTKVAVASCCNEPAWGAECIRKFAIGDGFFLKVCEHCSNGSFD